MIEVRATIRAGHGFHARPAARFIQEVRKFSSKVRVVLGSKEADARSIVGLMGLGAAAGDLITLKVEGEDEAAAAAALSRLLEEME